jgi:hypothetical protein
MFFYQPIKINRHDKAGKCFKAALSTHARTQAGGTIFTHAFRIELRF